MSALGGNYAPGIRGAFSYVTVSGAAKAGTITVYPDGAPGRAATVLAFAPRSTVSDSALVTPGSDGKVDFVNNSGGPVELQGLRRRGLP